MSNWKYYNHAALPVSVPYKDPDTSEIDNGAVWKMAGKPFVARWTTDFDLGHETNWWYVIKDTPFDINALKAKRRYEVNKGKKNFDVRLIVPGDFKEELFQIQTKAFAAYPAKYRPHVDKTEFFDRIDSWNTLPVFGAFFKDDGKLCGYSLLEPEDERFVRFSVQKTDPDYETYGLNAALVEAILAHYEDFLNNGGIICDGERSISHETKFQDYLEKYFGFRKAYCVLHVKYKPVLRPIVFILYPFRNLIKKLDKISIVHMVVALLNMESINRSSRDFKEKNNG